MGCIESKSLDTKSGNVVDLNGFGPNYRGNINNFINQREIIKIMSYPEQLQKVYDLTFPNSAYQPMSPDFTVGGYSYREAVDRFIINLQSMSSIYTEYISSNVTMWFKINNNDALDEFESFIRLHCPRDIVTRYRQFNDGSLFLQYYQFKV